MPVKNASKYLDECILSIIYQNFKDWELIAIDDHSTDNSFEILTDFTKNERIRAYSATGTGIIAALQQAYEASSGEYIHRMDADDLMPNSKLTELFRLMDGNPKQMVTGKVQYFSDSDVSEGYSAYENWINSIENYKAEVYRECTIASPNWLVSRSCFETDTPFKDLVYPEDYDLVLKWHAKEYEIIKSNELTHLWREHPERTSRNSDIYQQESFFRLKLRHFLKNELSTDEPLQLVGAGVKGKLVANILNEGQINFDWFDFRSDRVKSQVQIKDLDDLEPIGKTILTSWPQNQVKRDAIVTFMTEKGFVFGENLWLF